MSDEPRAPRAERQAHGYLAGPRRGASEQQVGDVRAGDQQHEGDGAEEDQQSLLNVADQLRVQRHEADSGAGIRFGMRRGELRREQ